MSCFTLGTSYRRRKVNSTTEYLDNKRETDLFTSHPNDDCGPLNFVTEQTNVKDSIETSNSLSNVSNEVACCSSPTPTLEKKSVRYKKRRKKKRAPPPPCSPVSTTNSFSSVSSKSANKIDDLPDAIGKLYAFNKTGYQNKQKERNSPQNISVLCKGRYARVIEEKPLKCNAGFEQAVLPNNLATEKQKSAKRKSAKKRRAPQPPQIMPINNSISMRQSEQNRIDGAWCNQLNSCHNIKFSANRMCFKNVNLSATQIQPVSPMQFSNLDPAFFKCNCITCKNGDNTAVFLPHVICPSLSNNAESSNITVLGYCNIDQIGRTVVIQNNNALLHSNNSNVTIPTPNTVHCSHCTPSSNIETRCYANCEKLKDSAESEEECNYKYYSMPFNHKSRSCSYHCERSHVDYVSQRMVEKKQNYDNYYLDKREISRRHHYSNNSQNEESYKKTPLSHVPTANFCSCSDKQWMSDENSDDGSENSDNYLLWEEEASNIAYSSEMNVVVPRRKVKSTHHLSECKPHKQSEDEFDGLQDLIKSRPSVRDFIAAFNYLTQKTNSDLDISNNGKLHHKSTYSSNKLTIQETDLENNFDLKSLPTKWRYSPVNIIADEKSLKEKEPDVNLSDHLVLPKCNKNKRVTFKKGTKSESKPSSNLRGSKHPSSFKNASSKCKVSQDIRINPPSTSIADIINMPCTHTISMAHRHASNQQLANSSVRQHTSKQSCYSPKRKVMHNGNSPKEIKSYINTDEPSPKSNQSVKHLGYKKAYRAPPVPDHAVFLQSGAKSTQNKVSARNCKISEGKLEMKDYPKEQITDESRNIDDKIWVSLYIEDKSSHKGLIPLLLSPTMTVKMLKVKLERQFGYPRDLQRWILGKSFATDDNATLASHNVTEAGCPIFLYMTAKNLPNEALSISKTTDQHQDTSSEESDSDFTDSDSGTVILASDTEQESSESSGTKPSVDIATGCYPPARKKNVSIAYNLRNKMEEPQKKHDFRGKRREQNNPTKTSEVMRENYRRWVEIEEKDLISNLEPFECPVCFLDVPANEGIMLKDCLHLFCKECLSNAVYYAEEAVIKCPFRNDEYSCDSHLQEREIKALVSPEVYERHLQRSIAAAESQAKNSFHCKSPDCPGWCLYEDKVNLFLCPVCGHLNCLTCQAIHEGRNCRQYQDELEFNSTTSDEAKKTKDYLDNMLKEGEAMRCPQCHIVLMKKWGCDWLKCSVCLTEVCWVTKGRRWGPAGRGDTSGGCRCGVNGVRCHPKCNYCH